MNKKETKIIKYMTLVVFGLVAAIIISVYCACLPDLIKYGGFNTASIEYLILRKKMIFLVSVIFFFVFIILTAIFSKPVIGASILAVLTIVVGIANQNMIFYRGQPLLPSDILQAKDAAIALHEGFQIYYPSGIIKVILITIAVLLLFIPLPGIRNRQNRKRGILISVALLVIFSIFLTVFFKEIVLNEKILKKKFGRNTSVNVGDMYFLNSFWGEFFAECIYLFPQAPSQYSQKSMDEIGVMIEQYEKNGELIDIITLQVESWQYTDNYDVTYGEDVFSNYNRLSKEGITGLMASPKYGGGTADIEYEVLTGFTTNDGYTSVTPFNNVVYNGFPSIVNYLRDNYGYDTFAVHAYTSELYNRPIAYRNLGFANIYFSDTFDNPKMCGLYISDPACVEKMLEIYEEACVKSDHIFMHGLTMQNHLPMGDDRFTTQDLVSAQSSSLMAPDLFIMQRFGTALKWTDEALGMLCDYLKNVDRKVLVLAYGDHQTSIYESKGIGDVLHHTDFYDTYDEEKDFMKLHGTPYIVWTNFDTSHGGETFGYCAPNMLLVNALNTYGVMCPDYWTYFATGVDSYKGGTANYIITNDNEIVFTMNDEQEEDYHNRMLIQYDMIYGKHYLEKYVE